MSAGELQRRIETLASEAEPRRDRVLPVLDELLRALEDGSVRAADRKPDGTWSANVWVKRGILLGFRVGRNVVDESSGGFAFRDRDTFPTWRPWERGRDVRIVPGGTTVRRGAFLADGVVVMPPAYVNVGAFVDRGSMIDSHALVGSCAQIGAGVHLSAAVQIGGVLEPVGAVPVIVEDGAFVGGGCGIYEGTRVGAGAVLAPGTILTRAVPIVDLVNGTTIRAAGDAPLVVPERAVVVPGSRPASGAHATRLGIQLQTPVIVKYRDPGTDASLVLEESLR